jgi:hypothetical protein
MALTLRGYQGQAEHRRLLDETQKRLLTEPITFLENTGGGEGYANAARARLVLTLCSTLGFEAFFCGPNKKTLFVNYAGNPFLYCSLDPRYQLYGEDADYAAFERRVDELLALEIPEPPAVAKDQHETPDGKVGERIANILSGPDFS